MFRLELDIHLGLKTYSVNERYIPGILGLIHTFYIKQDVIMKYQNGRAERNSKRADTTVDGTRSREGRGGR